jgi:hypothetical protein
MHRQRRRSDPTVTQLQRVEKVLEADPALSARLAPKTREARKRNGEMARFAPEAVAVAQALIARRLDPERAHVRVVLAVAVEVLGIIGAEDTAGPLS